MKKINWAIICYKDDEEGTMTVYHACGYEDEPSQEDADALSEELATDPEFGMMDQEYNMMLINRETGYKYFEMLGIPDEFPEK